MKGLNRAFCGRRARIIEDLNDIRMKPFLAPNAARFISERSRASRQVL